MKSKRGKTEKMLQKQCHLLPYNSGKIMLKLRKFGFTERKVFVKNKRQQKSKTQHTNTNTVSVHTTVVLIIITLRVFLLSLFYSVIIQYFFAEIMKDN